MAVHIVPLDDWIEHRPDECLCEPRIEWIDPKTDEPYPNGPMVIHERLSGPNNEPVPGLWAVMDG